MFSTTAVNTKAPKKMKHCFPNIFPFACIAYICCGNIFCFRGTTNVSDSFLIKKKKKFVSSTNAWKDHVSATMFSRFRRPHSTSNHCCPFISCTCQSVPIYARKLTCFLGKSTSERNKNFGELSTQEYEGLKKRNFCPPCWRRAFTL